MQGEIGEIFAHAARLESLHGGALHMSAPLGFDMIPLANEGKHHKTLRSRAAAAIATDRKGNAEAMDQYIAALVSRTFTADAEIELRNDIALPIFNHLYALWTGVELEAELNVSQVFCGRMSFNRRVEINSGIKARAEIACASIRIPPDVAVTFGSPLQRAGVNDDGSCSTSIRIDRFRHVEANCAGWTPAQ